MKSFGDAIFGFCVIGCYVDQSLRGILHADSCRADSEHINVVIAIAESYALLKRRACFFTEDVHHPALITACGEEIGIGRQLIDRKTRFG